MINESQIVDYGILQGERKDPVHLLQVTVCG